MSTPLIITSGGVSILSIKFKLYHEKDGGLDPHQIFGCRRHF